ncbi:MAG: 50S ribosomal protein L3 N(5)-glutamine methyltransferase [Proteobacteria bacterium]|nr:50S ribosomal protein L3 N(5)-glutamine methyltransferase [Pseudomonadota bacterium]
MTKEQLFIQLVEQLSSDKLFHGHAVIDAQDEAMMVMMRVFGEQVSEVLSTGNQEVSSTEYDKATAFTKSRLSSLKPMAYILGEVSFCGLVFKSDQRALVPRSPMAELIQSGFKPWLEMKNVTSALDLCTGGGCIGISLAKYNKHIKVGISDISEKALSLAEENKNKISVEVELIQSDLFQNIQGTYDLIVSNPPYVSETEYQELPDEYKTEPKLGLVAELDGLKIPAEIMLKAPEYLSNDGVLFLEVGYSDELLESMFPEIAFEWIEFNNGGDGVCVFNKKTLVKYRTLFESFLNEL